MKRNWQTIALVAVAALAVGMVVAQTGVLPRAYAQSEGVIGRVIVVMGAPQRQYAPIVLVDTLEQTMVVYEYNYSSRNVQLESVRSYRYDKQLLQFENSGVGIEEIRQLVESGNVIQNKRR